MTIDWQAAIDEGVLTPWQSAKYQRMIESHPNGAWTLHPPITLDQIESCILCRLIRWHLRRQGIEYKDET